MRMNKGEERRGEGWLISYCILNGTRRWPPDSRHIDGVSAFDRLRFQEVADDCFGFKEDIGVVAELG